MTLHTIDLFDARTNPMALSHLMDFDGIVRVVSPGVVDDDPDTSALPSVPDAYDSELNSTDSGWSLMSGYSGQDRYTGANMHPSEFIGGKLAEDILDNPGYYVALIDFASDPHEGESAEFRAEWDAHCSEYGCDHDIIGWVIARLGVDA